MGEVTGGEEAVLEVLRELTLHQGTLLDELRTARREIRGELAGIRTRLDSLVVIQNQLGYHGQRISGIERRLTTLVEMKLAAPPSAPERNKRASTSDTARACGERLPTAFESPPDAA